MRARILWSTLIFLFLFGCAGTRPAQVRQEPAPEPTVVRLSGTPGTLKVTRIAHATVLIEAGDQAILTDPWFTETRSKHPGEPLGIALDKLPKLTAVIVSHGHYDHYDMEGFSPYSDKSVPLIVRKDTGETARDEGFTDVRELDHWGSTQVGSVRITATPAKHGEPENTYILEMNGFTVFFGGDSLKIPELEEIPRKFSAIDLALMPINGLTVKGEQVVMNPEEAAEVVSLFKPKVAVPTHYRYHGDWLAETFLFTHPGTPEQFVAAAQKKAPETAVHVLETGAPLLIER